MRQDVLTDKALFDFYMVSSTRENEVYTPFPQYLDKQVFDGMVHSTCVLDKLVRRLIKRLIAGDCLLSVPMDQFPFKKEIFKLELSLPDFFWVRYDAFEKDGGGIFFSEFNYDKPCAQREIAVANMLNPCNNPNSEFIKKFTEGFRELVNKFKPELKKPRVGILVDPGHYEELHLAEFYMELLSTLGYEIIIAGGRNLYIENDKVMAFGKKLDIILRQFPTEFLHEIKDFEAILELYNKGDLLLINDPRAIIGQAKSLFAVLWEMVRNNDSFLSEEEIEIIKNTIPYTEVFKKEKVTELRREKDKYVIKAVFGRFSEEVYIGKMHSEEEWEETLEYVSNSPKLHIIQQFCHIKKECALCFNGSYYDETDAYRNFGIYLVNGEYAGTSLRLSNDYLSSEDNVWIGSLGLSERKYNVKYYEKADRKALWNSINDDAAFKYGFTGGYQGSQEAFTLDRLILDKNLYNELKGTSEALAQIFKKATNLVCENSDLLCPSIGISDGLKKIVTKNYTGYLTFIGRFDWVVDAAGRLKLLELNSETPAGLPESIILNAIIKERLNIGETDPNTNMKAMIANSFKNILKDYKRFREINNIGIVSSSYPEDWNNTRIIYELTEAEGYKITLGEVSGLHYDGKGLKLYGKALDAIYRYYPLDWFEKDPYFNGVIDGLADNAFSINPVTTFIPQSKAFFALLFELTESGFFNENESLLIKKYIPFTSLKKSKRFENIYCIKPFFEREGSGVAFSFKEPFPDGSREDVVYQEWIDIKSIALNIHSGSGSTRQIAYPVIGAYITGDSFSGIYTRAGGSITDKWAVYIPTYIGY